MLNKTIDKIKVSNDIKIEELYERIIGREFSNYHKHCNWSNITTPDCVIKSKDYINRAVELGHRNVWCTQHGTHIGFIEYYNLISEANSLIGKVKEIVADGNIEELEKLKKAYKKSGLDVELFYQKEVLGELIDKLYFRFGVEGYFSQNEEDNDLFHIFWGALNQEGMEEIISMLSYCSKEADRTKGFEKDDPEKRNLFRTRRPKPSLEIMKRFLNPKNVWCTTACIGGFIMKSHKAEEILVELKNIFGKNLFLEVQYHNIEKQKTQNGLCLDFNKKYGVELIAGLDSHMIFDEQKIDREAYLHSKATYYEDEDGFYLDYPPYEVVVERFIEQGILSKSQIIDSIEKTRDFILQEEEITFDTETLKIPTIYPDLTQEERNQKYTDLIYSKWNEYKHKVPKEKWEEYEHEIELEVDTVVSTNVSDYFLFNYELIKQSVERGGIITRTGRGSASSFITNFLLGFTNIDRIKAKVKLFRTRFLTADRILSGSIPDID